MFGAILRLKNLLSAFDEFAGKEILVERDFQDYCGRYLDLRDELRKVKPDVEDVNDDLVFEIELIKQVEINIDGLATVDIEKVLGLIEEFSKNLSNFFLVLKIIDNLFIKY